MAIGRFHEEMYTTVWDNCSATRPNAGRASRIGENEGTEIWCHPVGSHFTYYRVTFKQTLVVGFIYLLNYQNGSEEACYPISPKSTFYLTSTQIVGYPIAAL